MNHFFAIVPDHQMCIPEIGGAHLKEVEQTVNALMKLTIKMHAEKLGRAILIAPGAPVLHHRFAVATSDKLVRHFASNSDDREVHLEFPVDTTMVKNMEIYAQDKRVTLEPYKQKEDVVALDNGALSFLYYCAKLNYFPKITYVSLTDLGRDHYARMGKVLHESIKVEQERMAIVSLGHLSTEKQESEELIQSLYAADPFAWKEDKHITELAELGGTLPLSYLLGLETVTALYKDRPPFHMLGDEAYDTMRFVTGYFQ